MPWLIPPAGGGFFVRRVVRRRQEASPPQMGQTLPTRPTRRYVFEARIEAKDGHFNIGMVKWPRPADPNIPLDGVHTNLLNNSIIWIADDFAPRTAEAAIEWLDKWIECLLDYYDGGGPFTFPRDPNVY